VLLGLVYEGRLSVGGLIVLLRLLREVGDVVVELGVGWRGEVATAWRGQLRLVVVVGVLWGKGVAKLIVWTQRLLKTS